MVHFVDFDGNCKYILPYIDPTVDGRNPAPPNMYETL